MKRSFLLVLIFGILFSTPKAKSIDLKNSSKGDLSSGFVLYLLYSLHKHKILKIPEKKERYDCGKPGCEVVHYRVYTKKLIEVEWRKKLVIIPLYQDWG